MRHLVAADTGGSFTDIVVFNQRRKATQFGKTLANYRDLVAGVLDGLSDTDGHLDEAAVFNNGTTHVINAFVQRKGARTALVTTYYVVAPDLRGYGRITGWNADYDADLSPWRPTNLARDAVGLVYALGYRSVAAVIGRDPDLLHHGR